MDEKWNLMVRQDPSEGFYEGVKEFRAAFATKGEPNGEVICNSPADAEVSPKVRVDRENF